MSRSEHYRKLVDLTIKLHAIMRTDPDGEEADAIRDEMDDPWRDATAEEKWIANRVSGDLYTITKPPKPQDLNADSKALRAAMETQNWDGVLDALAKNPCLLEPAHRSEIRAMAYEGMGEPVLAAMFREHGRRLRETPA